MSKMQQANVRLREQLELQQRLLTGFETLIVDRLYLAQFEAIVAFNALAAVAQESHPEVSFKGHIATSLCDEFTAMQHIQWGRRMIPATQAVPPHIVSSLLARSTVVENYIALLRNWTERANRLFAQRDEVF